MTPITRGMPISVGPEDDPGVGVDALPQDELGTHEYHLLSAIVEGLLTQLARASEIIEGGGMALEYVHAVAGHTLFYSLQPFRKLSLGAKRVKPSAERSGRANSGAQGMARERSD